MIIEALINIVYGVFSVLTAVLKVPSMPVKVVEIVAIVLDYVSTGIAIVANYCDIAYLLVLFGVIFAVDSAVMLYHVIMWVLKKIPLLNIK